MATAAGHAGLVPRMLSFTGALQAVNIFGTALLLAAVPARKRFWRRSTARSARLVSASALIVSNRVPSNGDQNRIPS